MTAHHIRPDACPHCGRFVDAATGLTTATAPKPGSLTMCVYCGEWSAWQRDGKLGKLTTKEVLYVMTTPECIAATRMWRSSRL